MPLKWVIPATAGRKEATASDGSGKVKMPFGLSMAAFGAKEQEKMQNEEDAGGSGGADKEDKENIAIRYRWSMICSGVSVFFTLVVAAGLYQIHSHVNSA